jgi:D-glycero-D-manno-heptose 1,7-bisphosphate phosphatase
MACRPGIGAEALRAAGSPRTRHALFLDRDGVVNLDRGYTWRIEDFSFVDGVFELCRAAVERGYLLFVVTNQAGIGRGYYTEPDFVRLTEWMRARFEAAGLPAPCVYYCPHHPSAGIGPYLLDCPSRKPNPEMLLAAAAECGLDLGRSILLGDKDGDIEAGRRAGVGTLALLSSVPAEDGAPASPIRVATLADARARLWGVGAFPGSASS